MYSFSVTHIYVLLQCFLNQSFQITNWVSQILPTIPDSTRITWSVSNGILTNHLDTERWDRDLTITARPEDEDGQNTTTSTDTRWWKPCFIFVCALLHVCVCSSSYSYVCIHVCVSQSVINNVYGYDCVCLCMNVYMCRAHDCVYMSVSVYLNIFTNLLLICMIEYPL